MLKLYNTLTRKKEEFVPIEKGVAKVYSCGPTVYWFAHVGNFRAYVFADILRRVLAFNELEVKHIINVTDVGHLTSDADSGDDKMEESAKKEGKTAKEVSHFYFDAFLKDFKKLNLTEPMKWTWATEEIPEQLDMIKGLGEKGYTYKTSDGVYFDTSKFSDYGKLSRKQIENLEEGKRVDMGEKKNKTDFALWKFSRLEDKRQQEWDSPWGRGFPGWHIECSAMSAKYLGRTFDIHTGGEDHIPVHHENEIAQSTCCFGVRPCNFWMHGAFLNVKGGKMGKSLGNIETISELEKRGVEPLAYRYFTYSARYRKPLTWSEEGLQGAVASYKKLKNIVSSFEDDGKINEEYLEKFGERVNDDLDMPGALAVLWEMVRDDSAGGRVGAVKKMDEVLGLRLLEKEEKDISDVKELIEKRKEAKKNKDWKTSDRLREEIINAGHTLEDNKDGFIVSGTQIVI